MRAYGHDENAEGPSGNQALGPVRYEAIEGRHGSIVPVEAAGCQPKLDTEQSANIVCEMQLPRGTP
jgi:hypothetical protein